MPCPVSMRVIGSSASITVAGQQAEQQAAGREPRESDALATPGVVRRGERRLARLAEKHDAVELHHDVSGQRGGEGDRRRRDRHQHVQVGVRQVRREQERLQQQPFRDEAVQRRQAGDGEGADERRPGDPGHAVDQAAESSQAALARGVQHRAGAQEQQRLEERVVQAVVQGRGERQGGERGHAEAAKQQREAEPGDDQADVLDRRVGQQALHVGLHGGVHGAEQRTRQADCQRHHPPPPQRKGNQIEAHAQQSVHRGLQHDRAHQRGHRRGRGRVRLGQPGVQRQQARLGAEAGEREQKGRRQQAAAARHLAHRGKGVGAAAALQRAEAQQNRSGAEVGEQQVEVARTPHLGQAVVAGDEEVGGERHRFPGHHEEVGVVGEHHQRHAGEEQVVPETLQAGRRAFPAAEVAAGEDRDRRRHQAEQQQEERRERVEPRVERQRRQSERENARRGRLEQRGGDQDRERQAENRTERKQHGAHPAQCARPQQAGRAEHDPGERDAQCGV